MTDYHDQPITFTLAGKLQRDTILPLSGVPAIDIPGGNLVYAAAGMHLWGEQAGLLARVSPDFPLDWLERFEALGFDLQGIKVATEPIDMRRFAAYSDPQTAHYENPLTYFAERGLSFPSNLLAYEGNPSRLCSKNQYEAQSIHVNDMPEAYKEARAAHICPIDFMSHKILPSILRAGNVQTVTMSATPGYMDPIFWEEIPTLVSDLTAFMAGEDEVRKLFQGRSVDLWDIARQLASFGPEYVLIRLRDGGQYLYDGVSRKRWVVPAYPVQVDDPTGAPDAFAGAFLAIYRQTYDSLQATLCGNIAASFVVEGCGPYFALDAMQGLKEARLEALKDMVSEI